jgi:hypothetical protein
MQTFWGLMVVSAFICVICGSIRLYWFLLSEIYDVNFSLSAVDGPMAA